MKTNLTPINTKKPKWFESGLTQASYAVSGGAGRVQYVDRVH
jgi:hypothetical protein